MSRPVDPHLVSLVAPSSFAAEQYRVLGHVVEQLHKTGDLRIIAVTSPAVGDGKTTTAINLAGALAQAGEARVLLVDADLRRAAVQEQLGPGEAADVGLADAAANRGLSLTDLVRGGGSSCFAVLSAGRATTAPYEALKSSRVSELMDHARHEYDYVVVDTPPFVPAPDCRAISKWVDGFLLVVAADRTPRKLIEATLDVMDSRQLVGLVFNRSSDRPFAQYYDRYSAAPGRSGNGHRPGWWSRLTPDALLRRPLRLR
jgi:capsular exopolysaccharide synthesis family protein